MIKKIKIKNFSGFKDNILEFSPNLNIIIGANGTGKSHILKLLYTVLYSSAEYNYKNTNEMVTKSGFSSLLSEKFIRVFLPDSLGRLVKRRQGREKAEVNLVFSESKYNLAFSMSTNSKEVDMMLLPQRLLELKPVFLPTRELLTIFPGFISLYENYHLHFEEIYRDTCLLLDSPLSKGPKLDKIKKILDPIEDAMGGKLLTKNNRFYLKLKQGEELEIPLVAEGIRKVGMLARIIATGQLAEKNIFFWDEPEANLNPFMIKKIAQIIYELSFSGIQIFIATHSLFLLRELDIQNKKVKNDDKLRYISLNNNNEDFNVEQGSDIESIQQITSLEEELKQSDEYLDVVNGN